MDIQGRTRAESIGIVGVGRLGATLARGLAQMGRPILIASRTAQTELLVELGGAASMLPPDQVVARAQLVFLTVPDASVASVCAALPWQPDSAAVHTCGGLGLEALDSARARAAAVGVFHPLASFTRDAGLAQFSGVAIGVEAELPLEARLQAIARGLGGAPFSLRGVSRPAYHAAAVLASNYVVALHVAAARAFELAGLPPEQARAALAPLTRGAADNIARLPLVEALTGPASRADLETIANHLGALAIDAPLASLYRALGRELLRLPLEISEPARAAMIALFDERQERS